MFASHLQWRRTDSHQTPAEWQSPSLFPLSGGLCLLASLFFFFFPGGGVGKGGSGGRGEAVPHLPQSPEKCP